MAAASLPPKACVRHARAHNIAARGRPGAVAMVVAHHADRDGAELCRFDHDPSPAAMRHRFRCRCLTRRAPACSSATTSTVNRLCSSDRGLMNNGSAWGQGVYPGPDWLSLGSEPQLGRIPPRPWSDITAISRWPRRRRVRCCLSMTWRQPLSHARMDVPRRSRRSDECIADDVKPGKLTPFPQAVKLKDGEVVVFRGSSAPRAAIGIASTSG